MVEDTHNGQHLRHIEEPSMYLLIIKKYLKSDKRERPDFFLHFLYRGTSLS